ncbi:hypothetical protein NT239_12185 [Chitinibacter sp. SCUT-21]|uniref:hypothetical protein n=1 Tax=Chitinibacter sp. SCUT-21 TaxID=2970891 RepID=UPI0035A6D04C
MKYFFLLLLSLFLSAGSHAAKIVKVGAAVFPPYIVERNNGDLYIELLDVMNAFQDQYQFVVVASNPSRRFIDFDRGLFDVSFYDNLAWGWQGRSVEASPIFLRGCERYVALKKAGRDQSFFAEFDKKRMLGLRGYHYQFAQYNADPQYLLKHFRMIGSLNHDATLRQLKAGRGDIALLTEAYLLQKLASEPQLQDQLLIGTVPDQVYHHTVVVRKGTSPSAAEIGELLEKMERTGALQPLWQKYGTGHACEKKRN